MDYYGHHRSQLSCPIQLTHFLWHELIEHLKAVTLPVSPEALATRLWAAGHLHRGVKSQKLARRMVAVSIWQQQLTRCRAVQLARGLYRWSESRLKIASDREALAIRGSARISAVRRRRRLRSWRRLTRCGKAGAHLALLSSTRAVASLMEATQKWRQSNRDEQYASELVVRVFSELSAREEQRRTDRLQQWRLVSRQTVRAKEAMETANNWSSGIECAAAFCNWQIGPMLRRRWCMWMQRAVHQHRVRARKKVFWFWLDKAAAAAEHQVIALRTGLVP